MLETNLGHIKISRNLFCEPCCTHLITCFQLKPLHVLFCSVLIIFIILSCMCLLYCAEKKLRRYHSAPNTLHILIDCLDRYENGNNWFGDLTVWCLRGDSVWTHAVGPQSLSQKWVQVT